MGIACPTEGEGISILQSLLIVASSMPSSCRTLPILRAVSCAFHALRSRVKGAGMQSHTSKDSKGFNGVRADKTGGPLIDAHSVFLEKGLGVHQAVHAAGEP